MRSVNLAPIVVISSLLGAAGALGAPAALLLWMAGIMAVATVFSGRMSASAFAHLARVRCGPGSWAQGWSFEHREGPRRRRDGLDQGLLATDLMPDDDLRATRAWLRTLDGIRTLPETSSRR